MRRTLEIEPIECRPSRLVTARTYLVDRFTPDCEDITLPAVPVRGGTLTWTRGDVCFPARPAGRRVVKQLKRLRPIVADPDNILLDLRLHDPQNWAHFLTNHLPLFFRIAKAEDLPYGACTLVLPEKIPAHIITAAGLFGLRVLNTDAEVRGYGLTFDITPWAAGRAARAGWVARSMAETCLQAAEEAAGPIHLPDRVFISRRDSRCLENEEAVTAFLAERGYQRLYAEDLSPLDQFRLFRTAREIVAIHGAALAPLLYCPANARPARLVELMPCGHMTNVFRVIAQQVGTDWIGVRGKIKPEHVAPAYALDQRFTQFSLQSFEIDLPALDRALELVGGGMHA